MDAAALVAVVTSPLAFVDVVSRQHGISGRTSHPGHQFAVSRSGTRGGLSREGLGPWRQHALSEFTGFEYDTSASIGGIVR